MIRLFFRLLLSVLALCSELLAQNPPVGKAIQKHVEWVCEKYHLKLSYQGISMPDGPIREVILGFSTQKKLSLTETRILFVDCAEDLLRRINSTPELRPWLFVYPFTFQDLSYAIAFDDFQSGTVEAPFIASVFMGRDEIVYRVWDSKLGDRRDVLRESFSSGIKAAHEEPNKSELEN